MKIEIICKDYHLDSNLKSIIEKKLSKFDRYFDGKAKAKVKLSTFKNFYIMEVTISEDDLIVRAKNQDEKMNRNIDFVLPKLERQILKYKNKFKNKNKKGSFDEPAIYENELVDLPKSEKVDKVVKVKKFNITITSLDNAIEEMDLLDHNFFVFVNGETNKVNILYRRNDGNLGLIEPEY